MIVGISDANKDTEEKIDNVNNQIKDEKSGKGEMREVPQ